MKLPNADKGSPATVDTPGRGQIAVDWVLIRDTSTPHPQQSKQERCAAALAGRRVVGRRGYREKGAKRLMKAGLLATCAHANRWTDNIASHFVDRDVIVLPKRDEAGEKNAVRPELNEEGPRGLGGTRAAPTSQSA